MRVARLGVPRVFVELLANTLVSGVTSSFLWFALTFWVFLSTRSVVATGVIGGAFSIATAILGPAFGTIQDRQLLAVSKVLAHTTSRRSGGAVGCDCCGRYVARF